MCFNVDFKDKWCNMREFGVLDVVDVMGGVEEE